MDAPKFAILILLILLFITISESQRYRYKKKQRTSKPTTKPAGGKWIPRRQRIAEAKRKLARNNRLKNQKLGNQQPRNQQPRNNQNGNSHFDSLVRPPLRRSEDEPDLQEPSWTHCVHRIEVGESWARIASPGYPKNINGQMQCTWIVTGIRGMRIQLSFNDLDLQDGKAGRCGNQFVDVIDMELLKSQGRFCGSSVPGDYVTAGRRLRLDIQGDTTMEPHKGFQAAVRSVPQSTQPGLRRRSEMYHGPVKPTNPAITRRLAGPIRRQRTTTAPTTTTRAEPIRRNNGQIIYGPNKQPIKLNVTPNEVKPATKVTSIILYVFIAIFCLLVVLSGIGFVFRKQVYAKYKDFKRKRKNKNEPEKSDEDLEYATKDSGSAEIDASEPRTNPHSRFELPVSRVSTPSLDGRRRKSVVFEDEVLAGLVRDPASRDDPMSESERSRDSDKNYLHKFPQENNTQRFQGWNYPHGEPVYEEDTMSVQSSSSARSLSRHPEHLSLKQKKILEKNKALREEDIYAPLSEPLYHFRPSHHPGASMIPPCNVVPHQKPPFQIGPNFDPRTGHIENLSMMPQDDPYVGGRPFMSPGYHGPRGNYNHLPDFQDVIPVPHFSRYPPYRNHSLPPQLFRSQDDLALPERFRESSQNVHSEMSSARSMTDLTSEKDTDFQDFTSIQSTRSLTDLSKSDVSSNKRRSSLRRSNSFSM